MKIQFGETVLVPDYHHGNEVQAIEAAGAKLKFYRVDKQLRIDPEEVEKLCTPEVRALFVIHYIGWPTHLDDLAAIAKKKNIPLIEDCALSLLAEDRGRPIGTTGDYSIFCLYKTLPVPNGGLLVQNRNIIEELDHLEKDLIVPDNASLVGRSLELGLETLMTHAEPLGKSLLAAKRAVGSLLNAAHVKRANVGDVGFDFNRANLAISPVCLRLLDRIDFESIPEKRRILFAYLADKLRGSIDFLFDEAGPGTCPLFFPVLVEDKHHFSEELNKRGIGAVEFWNRGHAGVDRERATDALYLRDRLVELPIHQDVTFEQLDYIADQVLELRGKKPAPKLTLVPKDEVQVEVIRGTIEAVEGLSEEWAALAAEDPANQPFCRPEWISAYLRAFEPNAELLMITARRDGRLRGILPMIEEWGTFVGLPAHKLRFPANIHSSRADLILGTTDREISGRAIWSRLKNLSAWHVLEIRDVPEGGAANSLLNFAERDGWPIGRWESMNSPYLSLEHGGAETTSKFRANLRRRMRNLESRGPVEFERIDRADRELLGLFYELEQSGWKGRAGSAIVQNAATKQYYDEIAELSARLGMLNIYVLRSAGQVIAMQYGLTAGKRYCLSKPAYAENYAEYSPGQLLMEKVIADCVARGLSELDFLGMPMSWKLDWTKHVRRHEFCYVFKNSNYGAALRAAKFELIPFAKHALEEAHLRRAA